MGLETGTGIGDLVPANPLSTDAVSSGDDHLRLIKTVMQSITFMRNIVTFTASGTWTRPTNVRKILIYCLGGGSGGCGASTNSFAGGGGAGGGIALKWLDVTAIASATVTIGAGGAGGATAGGIGSPGGDTIFSSAGPVNHCIGKGGGPGSNFNQGGIASPLTTNVGDIKFFGGNGMTGDAPNTTAANGGNGGGGGGARQQESAESNTGGGGGGAGSLPGSGGAGGTGGSGYCVVLEFGW